MNAILLGRNLKNRRMFKWHSWGQDRFQFPSAASLTRLAWTATDARWGLATPSRGLGMPYRLED